MMYRKIALLAVLVTMTFTITVPSAQPVALAQVEGDSPQTSGFESQVPPEIVIGVIVGLIMMLLEQGLSPEEIQKRLEAAEQAWKDAMDYYREHYGNDPAGGGGGQEITTSSQDGPER